MKKKGFTLIELLAVIVILAIIAVITVPMIMNVIDKAKLGALEDSAYGLVESANLYYSSNIQDGLDTTEFTCDKTGCINEHKKLNYKGTIDSGKVKIYSDGKISVCIENEKNAAIKKATETKVTSSIGSCNTTNDEYSIDEVVSLNKYNEIKEKYNLLIEKGNATASDILETKTAVVNGEEITGNMINKGALNWNPLTNESKIIEPGYYSGGTLSTSNAYDNALESQIKKSEIVSVLQSRGVTTLDENSSNQEILDALKTFREPKVYEVVDDFWFARGASGTRTIDISSRGYLEILRVDLKCTNADGGSWSLVSFDTNKIVVNYSSYGPSSSFSTTVYAVK